MAFVCNDRGSVLTEAALVIPCLVLAIFWSAGVTDVLVLKLKAAEAARYALWESTVFKPATQIDAEVARNFADLASPRDVRLQHTGLVLYPRAADLRWRTSIDTGSATAPLLTGPLAVGADAAFRTLRFDDHGVALARVALVARQDARSPIPRGGDLGAPGLLRNLTLEAPLASHRPLRLVFDGWKAWPRPAPWAPAGASTDLSTAPSRTYPVVEKQVAARLEPITFVGARRMPGFGELQGFAASLARSGLGQAVAGGVLPDIFSAGRMDDMATNRGPVTILPPERAAESWVPRRCEIAGADVECPTRRAGDVTAASDHAGPLDGDNSLGAGVDRPRYTLPYRIRSVYWKRYGGMDRELRRTLVAPIPRKLSDENAYVQSYACRGHFFAGSREPQHANRFGSCR